ncbi:MAG: hypothetical protein WC429_06245 [Verrucomicrobiia bacterium]|jgi:hypothetical protein
MARFLTGCVSVSAQYHRGMTALQIIEEIKHLPTKEQAKVIRFAYKLDAERQLSGPELGALAARLADTHDPAEAAVLRETITHGFYGSKGHA